MRDKFWSETRRRVLTERAEKLSRLIGEPVKPEALRLDELTGCWAYPVYGAWRRVAGRMQRHVVRVYLYDENWSEWYGAEVEAVCCRYGWTSGQLDRLENELRRTAGASTALDAESGPVHEEGDQVRRFELPF